MIGTMGRSFCKKYNGILQNEANASRQGSMVWLPIL